MGKQFSIFKFSSYFAVLSISLILSACGNNILSSFEPETGNLSSALDQASTTADYTAISEAATTIIDSTSSSDQEKEDAYLARAEAGLGEQGLSTLDLFEDIISAIDSGGNTLDVLDVSANVESLTSSSNDINEAETLSGADGLTDEENVLKAVTNTMIIVNRFNANFEIDNNNDVQRLNNSLTYETSLTNFVTVPDNISIYNTRAEDGFNNANSLSEAQLAEISEVTSDTTKVVQLQVAVAANQDITIQGTTYTFSANPTTNGDTVREGKISSALSAIYGD